MQGFGRLSMVAASAAQSAANVVQAGTKELTSKVFRFVSLGGINACLLFLLLRSSVLSFGCPRIAMIRCSHEFCICYLITKPRK